MPLGRSSRGGIWLGADDVGVAEFEVEVVVDEGDKLFGAGVDANMEGIVLVAVAGGVEALPSPLNWRFESDVPESDGSKSDMSKPVSSPS